MQYFIPQKISVEEFTSQIDFLQPSKQFFKGPFEVVQIDSGDKYHSLFSFLQMQNVDLFPPGLLKTLLKFICPLFGLTN